MSEQVQADKMLERIRALLAKAAATEFEAEALAFTSKAHQLMENYSIEMAQVNAAKQAQFKEKPIHIEIRLFSQHTNRIDYEAQRNLLSVVRRHNRCEGWTESSRGIFHIYGYERDARFVEMLYTMLWEQMESRFRSDVVIEPSYNSKAKSGKVKFVAINQDILRATERGPHYRLEYMRGFAERIDTRFTEMAKERTGSAELILRDMKQDIAALFNQDVQARGIRLVPHNAMATVRDMDARESGMRAADKANLRPTSGLRQTPELGR